MGSYPDKILTIELENIYLLNITTCPHEVSLLFSFTPPKELLLVLE